MRISIKNLSKKYKKNIVLDDLSLDIKPGSLFGLLGPNGAGKTTLVSILTCLIKKDDGCIKIGDFDLDKDVKAIKSVTSYVPQTFAFYPNLSIFENLEFFGSIYGLKNEKLKNQIEYCVYVSSLNNFINKKAIELSGGVKRRLNIAIGLLNSPKIMYLDEPTVGIDPQSRQFILEKIKQISQENNTTIIYTSHYMEEVEFLCDDIAILDKNKIILHEKKEILLKNNKLIKIELENEIINFNIKNKGLNYFIEFCHNLIKEKKVIKNIEFSSKSLENMFLSLTEKKLRD